MKERLTEVSGCKRGIDEYEEQSRGKSEMTRGVECSGREVLSVVEESR